jgi:anionic cell wall polymer biosynthesis LytR-Cps2A-Psr (LCP) family protein
MRKHPNSVDGFIPRRASSNLGDQHSKQPPKGFTPIASRPEIGKPTRPIASQQAMRPIGQAIRTEIDESLAGIDEEEPVKKRRGLFRRKRAAVKPPSRRKKILKRIALGILIVAVLIGGFVLVKGILASSKVFQGNLFGLFSNQPLKMDANGRSNILLFGTSEDDPGHQAPYLTDSIMVLSIDQKTKNAYMMSIPRDLWVEYGKACLSGYAGKINEVYGCNSELGKNEKEGAAALKTKVGSILGLDIQYYAHVNYSVVRDVVKALGNITVNIEGSGGAVGVMDSNFDWKCGANYYRRIEKCPPNGHFIEYKNGPATLDAEHALYLAQARGDIAPTYGLGRSNFDREINQQKIIKAIREKALSAGTLTNFAKVAELMDAIGNNLRTNFETGEVRTLVSLGQDIPSEEIKSISFIEEGNELFVGANFSGAVVPQAGQYEYGQIQEFVEKKLSSNPVVREAANIVILNGTNVVGRAQTESDTLTDAGYTVTSTDNAPSNDYTKAIVYQLEKGYSGTKAALEKRYKTKVVTTKPAFTVPSGTTFVVIVGASGSNTD